jgi:hypothetical protein
MDVGGRATQDAVAERGLARTVIQKGSKKHSGYVLKLYPISHTTEQFIGNGARLLCDFIDR